MRMALIPLLLAVLFGLAGCVVPIGGLALPTGAAQPRPDPAEEYVQASILDLAEQLALSSDLIELESITDPTAETNAYIILLRANDRIYTYHGQGGEVRLVEEPLSPQTSVMATPGPDTTVLPAVEPIAVGADPSAEYGEDPFTITGVALAGHVLEIEVSYTGGCGEHQFTLVAAPGFEESDPVQAMLQLFHNAGGDTCEAIVTETLLFDLTPLKEAWQESYGQEAGTMTLNLAGAPESIRYQFTQ